MTEIDSGKFESEKELIEHLKQSKAVDITGIVSPKGVGGGKIQGEKLWSLNLEFDAWRIGAEKIKTNKLKIHKLVKLKDLEKLQKVINGESIIRIRARLEQKYIFGNSNALLQKIIKSNVNDTELQQYLEKLMIPVIYEDNLLGLFTFERGLGWYTAKVIWNNILIELCLTVENKNEINAPLEVAHELWNKQIYWNRQISDYAVKELLKLKNECWRDDNENEVNAEEFNKRIQLSSIIIYSDGYFEFWYGDGNLFGGHSIQISGNVKEGPTSADISG